VTNQEIFDRVYRHLLTQNAQAYDGDCGGCRYRDEQGRKCAVGCLISDDDYKPALEGTLVSSIDLAYPPSNKQTRLSLLYRIVAQIVPDQTGVSLLHELQTVHDTVDVENWPKRLCEVAKQFKLTVPARTTT